jgi:hypothetical protein
VRLFHASARARHSFGVMCLESKLAQRIALIFLCVAALMLAVGCDSDIHFDLPKNETLKLHVYSGGGPLVEKELAPSSKENQQLALWLAANTKGWSSTPASYVPGVYVTGKEFSINFLKTSVIINYAGGQYAKPVDPKEYEFLLQ